MNIEEITELEEKKEYLRKYLDCVKASKRIEGQITELRYDKMHPSLRQDGMPHGNGKRDLSDYSVALENLEDKMLAARYRVIKCYTDIFEKIEQMNTEGEKQILTLRYIKGCTFEEIADEIGYSQRQVTRLHTKALEHFKMA